MTVDTYTEPKDAIPCRSCGAPIIFVRTAKGKLNPINADGPDRGVSHFTTCPDAKTWRKK